VVKRKWTWMLVAAALALAGGVTAALARQGRELDTSFRSISLRGPVHALVVVPPLKPTTVPFDPVTSDLVRMRCLPVGHVVGDRSGDPGGFRGRSSSRRWSR